MDENNNQGYEPIKTPQDVKYYQETIITPKPKKSMSRWIVGTLAAALVGGTSVGTSYAVTHKMIQDYALSVATNKQENQTSQANKYKVMSTMVDNPISQIAADVGPSVVSIINDQVVQTMFGDYQQSGLGSGVIFKEDTEKVYIVTNAHVVESASGLTVNFLGNYKATAKLVGMDSQTDIAVVAVNKADIPEEAKGDIVVAKLGDSDTLKVGEAAVAIGTPIDEAYNNTVTVGVISALNRKVSLTDKELNLIQTDAAINPGNSGGALVGTEGEVIGINTVKLVDSKIEGMGFAIPINDVKPIIEEIITNGRVKRPSLGITGTSMAESLGQTYEIPVGVYVVSVVSGSSADLAGIKEKDIILEFDGKKITTIEELKTMLQTKQIGDVVKVRIVRSGEKKELTVQLKEAAQVTYNS